QECAVGVEQWLFNLGVTEKLLDMGYTENDLDKLVDLAFNTPSLDILLGVAPIKATKEVVRSIFEDSLKPMA
ncbi:MAG TPA: alcohol dehydrogenase, partial [Peptococcaceae bacterium]|nr:alcohol dehydrogenase [Peptococcaceae bacterium]